MLTTRGELFACGDPRSDRHEHGLAATRFVIRKQAWEAAVISFISSARIVVVIAGLTPGLRTELDEIHNRGYTGKTILVFPPSKREAMRRRVEAVAAHLGPMFDVPPRGKLLAAVVRHERWVPICSRATDGLDYACALRRAVRELDERGAGQLAGNGAQS